MVNGVSHLFFFTTKEPNHLLRCLALLSNALPVSGKAEYGYWSFT